MRWSSNEWSFVDVHGSIQKLLILTRRSPRSMKDQTRHSICLSVPCCPLKPRRPTLTRQNGKGNVEWGFSEFCSPRVERYSRASALRPQSLWSLLCCPAHPIPSGSSSYSTSTSISIPLCNLVLDGDVLRWQRCMARGWRGKGEQLRVIKSDVSRHSPGMFDCPHEL